MQMIWVAMLFVPKSLVLFGFFTFAVAEMMVPVWAERAAPTTWHPHHIAERYGLLTIIVLGESILTATMAIESAMAGGETFVRLMSLVIGGLLIIYSLWWLYFYRPVKGYSPGVQSLAREARDLILDLMGGDAQESIDTSGPYAFYSYAAPRLGGPRSGQAGYKGLVCSLILSKTGVKLGLSHGATLEDPHKLLEGAGKLHKHIALKPSTDLKRPPVKALVKAAIKRWHATRT